MILDHVLEIKKAENDAAESKVETRAKAKKILVSAEDSGKKYYEDSISAANNAVSAAEKKAVDEADKILEYATTDAKIKSDAIRFEAAGNINAAVSIIISNIYKKFGECLP